MRCAMGWLYMTRILVSSLRNWSKEYFLRCALLLHYFPSSQLLTFPMRSRYYSTSEHTSTKLGLLRLVVTYAYPLAH